MVKGPEHEGAGAGATDEMTRPREPFVPEVPDDGACGSGPAERVKQQADGVLHVRIGVERELPAGVDDKPDRRLHPQLPAARFIHLAANQPCAQHMKFCLRHCSL